MIDQADRKMPYHTALNIKSITLALLFTSAPTVAEDFYAGNCIDTNNNTTKSNSLSIILVNKCNFPIDTSYCFFKPKPGSYAEAFNCERNSFGSQGLPPMGKAAITFHDGTFNILACRSPAIARRNTLTDGECKPTTAYRYSDKKQLTDEHEKESQPLFTPQQNIPSTSTDLTHTNKNTTINPEQVGTIINIIEAIGEERARQSENAEIKRQQNKIEAELLEEKTREINSRINKLERELEEIKIEDKKQALKDKEEFNKTSSEFEKAATEF